MRKIFYERIVIMIVGVVCWGCGDGYLEEKASKGLVVPTTREDFWALLDNTQVMNVTPAIQIIASDDIYIPDVSLVGLSAFERNCYSWAKDVYQGQLYCSEWNNAHQQIFYANVVLEGLDKIGEEHDAEWKALRGSALFYRAFALHQLSQVFADYNISSELGVCIRTTADVNAPIARSTVQQTYDQILSDLKEAEVLLPATARVKTRASKVACDAFLARVYLEIGEYKEAETFATRSLDVVDTLMDYNMLSAEANRPITRLNDETLFFGGSIAYLFVSSTTSFVDTTLYASYDDNDLRKVIFFRKRGENRYTFKGNYTGSIAYFGGFAVDEVYLIRAECFARLGDVESALEDINTLLVKRWKEGAFVPVSETDSDKLLRIILDERRKELAFRLRWSDLKRLNRDDRFSKTLTRTIDGVNNTLPPNDNRYLFPIPQQEIIASGIQQNPR